MHTRTNTHIAHREAQARANNKLEIISTRFPMKLVWYAVVAGQGDIKNFVKRGGHRVCFDATMLTNTVI